MILTTIYERLNISISIPAATLIGLSIMLFVGFLLTRITKPLKLPNVTAYIFTGVLLGPVFRLIFNTEIIDPEVIGGMGFLADIKFEDLDETLDEIFNNNYRIEMRMLLKTQFINSSIETAQATNKYLNYSLNEVAILKQDTSSMLTIHAFIDDEYLTSYQADGLVVATPTGSTAYSLSIGGPIMVPTAPNIILTAIAPHSLNARPLVVDSNSKISLKVESRSSNYLVSLDGESQTLEVGTLLEICKATYAQPVVKRCGHTFFETLRNKLMWGADIRSSQRIK